MVRRRVVVGDVVPSGVGGWQVVASGLNRGSLVGVQSVRVVGAGESAAARVAGRELPLSGAAGRVRGGLSLNGWRRTCVCGIWLGVAQWDMQAGVCACGRRLLYKWARDGPYKSLDVPLVPRVPRPMPDWYGWIQVFSTRLLFWELRIQLQPLPAGLHAALRCGQLDSAGAAALLLGGSVRFELSCPSLQSLSVSHAPAWLKFLRSSSSDWICTALLSITNPPHLAIAHVFRNGCCVSCCINTSNLKFGSEI